MERGISKRHIQKINKFSEDARPLLEARNRAAHDPIGTENGKPVQLQMTACNKAVFKMREVTLDELTKTRDQISALDERFDDLANEILHELVTLPPYRALMVFPQITRSRIDPY
jgi:hypothetical protein